MSRRSATRSTAKLSTSLLMPTLMVISTSSSEALTVARRPYKVSTDGASTTARSALPTLWTKFTTPFTELQPSSTECGSFWTTYGKAIHFSLFFFEPASCRAMNSCSGRSRLRVLW
jgi:hypothetical protein